MTSQTGKNRHCWRRIVTGGLAGSAVVAGLLAGFAAPTALADPADPTPTQPEISPEMSADDALAIIARDYDMGAGGGQLSNLIHQALQLRSLGFKASISGVWFGRCSRAFAIACLFAFEALKPRLRSCSAWWIKLESWPPPAPVS